MTIWGTHSDTKYLGTVNNKLCFQSNSDVLCIMMPKCLFFWRKMSYFQVSSALMMFYRGDIGSVHIVAWFGRLYLVNKERLAKLTSDC